MKGTLLLLALLVIGELGFQTTEACAPFFATYFTILSGNKKVMNAQLSRFDASTEELEAFEKLQGCYDEGGLQTKIFNPKVMESMVFSPECLKYYGKEAVTKIVDAFTKFKAFIG